MGRRRPNGLDIMHLQDPGKDLFAYLFLLIMVFSFMLLMTMDERIEALQGKNAPEQVVASSGLTTVAQGTVGRLLKRDGHLLMDFGGREFSPEAIADLTAAGMIIEHDNGKGQMIKTIYIQKEAESTVLLSEYLQAFISLNQNGISVAFAEML